MEDFLPATSTGGKIMAYSTASTFSALFRVQLPEASVKSPPLVQE